MADRPMLDLSVYLTRAEGPHFERKSLFERTAIGTRKPRDRKGVRDQIAEYVAGFANNEGGVLILGIEDDGEVTGHDYPDAVVMQMLNVPAERLRPAQPPGQAMAHDGKALLVFEVDAASEPVHFIGDGYPLRMGESTVKAQVEQIRALKFQGLVESFEARESACALGDLDLALLAEAKTGAGLTSLPDETYLAKRRLAARDGTRLRLRQAAELLFAQDAPEHPNAGVRIFRVIGTERRTGLDHNVEELQRIEGPLPTVLEEAYRVVGGLLRKPSRLGPGGRFQQTTEYPEFCWKEAILNAVAHRDYAIAGRGVEVWLFDDRMEVSGPGGLAQGVNLEQLLSLERIHISRNPRLVRTLVDIGYMRDQGEGLPRMFAEMEGQFLPKPVVTASDNLFSITLHNTPELTEADRRFIAGLGDNELTRHEWRAMLEALRHGRVDNARMRSVAGLDTLAASKLLRALRDRGLLQDHEKGAATYYTLADAVRPDQAPVNPVDRPELAPISTGVRSLSTSDRQELGSEAPQGDSPPYPGGEALPEGLQAALRDLGERPRRAKLRKMIEQLCAWRPLTASALGALLGQRGDNLAKRHLGPMVAEGKLEHTEPDAPNHPNQAYRARQLKLPNRDG